VNGEWNAVPSASAAATARGHTAAPPVKADPPGDAVNAPEGKAPKSSAAAAQRPENGGRSGCPRLQKRK